MSRWRTLDGQPPQIIAHRGASGLFPEHVMPGYAQGLDDGADWIEPDLVPSSDGELFCRHEPQLARSTDIAARPEFSATARGNDWWSCDLPAEAIDRLRCRQPFAGRPSQHDGRYSPPRFSAVIAWAAAEAAARAQTVRLYPEIKHPAAMAERGRDPLPRFIEQVRAAPAQVTIAVQCFERAALRRLREALPIDCALLLDSRNEPLKVLREGSEGLASLALSKKLLHGSRGVERIEAIHGAGLRVDAWTFRDDELGAGFACIDDELRWAMELGADRLFCDYPASGVRVRAALRAQAGA